MCAVNIEKRRKRIVLRWTITLQVERTHIRGRRTRPQVSAPHTAAQEAPRCRRRPWARSPRGRGPSETFTITRTRRCHGRTHNNVGNSCKRHYYFPGPYLTTFAMPDSFKLDSFFRQPTFFLAQIRTFNCSIILLKVQCASFDSLAKRLPVMMMMMITVNEMLSCELFYDVCLTTLISLVVSDLSSEVSDQRFFYKNDMTKRLN